MSDRGGHYYDPKYSPSRIGGGPPATVPPNRPGRFGLGPKTPVLGLLFVADVAWLLIWSTTLGTWIGGSGPVAGAPTIGLVVMLAALLPRWLFGSGHSRAVANPARNAGPDRLAAGVLGLAAGLIVSGSYWFFPNFDLSPSAVGTLSAGSFLLAIAAWWRGMVLGRSKADVHSVERAFRLGMVAIGCLLAIVALAGPPRPDAGALVPPTFMFLGAGLVALPLARVVEVSELARRREGRGFDTGGAWLGLLIGLVLILLAMTLLIANIATFERIEALLRPLDDAISRLLYILLLPVAYLVAYLFELIAPLFRQAPQDRPPMDVGGALMNALRGQSSAMPGLSPEIVTAIKVLLGLALAAGVIYVLARALPARRRGDDDDTAFVETREIILRWPGWRVLLSRLIAWLLGRLRPRTTVAESDAPTDDPDAPPARGVRALYRQFLALAESVGRPRHPAETPREYASRLAPLLPGEAEVGEITSGYAGVRYDRPMPDDSPVAERLAPSLERLKSLWASDDGDTPPA